jgi:hypothetical protein
MTEEIRINTIISAQPDWYLSIFIPARADDPAHFFHETIVAWDIERIEEPCNTRRSGGPFVRRHTVPITAEGTNIDIISNEWAIRRPDGKFIVGDTICQNEADAIAELSPHKSADEAPSW